MSEIEGSCRVDARRYAGLHTVPIEQIQGSEGRSNDFVRVWLGVPAAQWGR